MIIAELDLNLNLQDNDLNPVFYHHVCSFFSMFSFKIAIFNLD